MQALHQAICERCPEVPAALIDTHFRRAPASYFDRHDLDAIARHLRLLAQVRPGRPFLVEASPPGPHGTDLTVAGLDQPGLMACLTAALARDGFTLADLNVAVYQKDPAAPADADLFVMHLTVRGPSDPPADYAHHLTHRLMAAWPHLASRSFDQARAVAAEAPTPISSPPLEPAVLPDLLGGDFLLREPLAIGGMSEVFLAEQLSLRRTVVVKVSRTREQPDPIGIDRFTREAVTLARLPSPYIVPVLAAGAITMAGGRRAWFAMEYLPGGDLGRRLREQGPVPVESGCRWLRQALQGLLDAHRRGVIHRDLKPHNLLLTADGDLKLADFGLFQPLAAPAETAGSVSGTPPYMSPEQAAGRPLDGRSDLFSLGSTFFQLFTGRLPFPGDDPADVMARLIRLDAPRLCQVASSLPLPLDVILGRMMARDPLARYQDARIALDDLASYESRGLIRAVDLTLATDDATDDLALTATHHEAPPTGG